MIIYLVVLLKCLFVVYMFIFYSTSRVFFRIVGDSAMSDEISPSSRTWVYLFNFLNCRQEFAVCIQKWGKTVLHSFYYEDDQTRWRLMENRSSFISHEALVPVGGNSTVIDGFYSVVRSFKRFTSIVIYRSTFELDVQNDPLNRISHIRFWKRENKILFWSAGKVI
jgi:hypothetical protein